MGDEVKLLANFGRGEYNGVFIYTGKSELIDKYTEYCFCGRDNVVSNIYTI